MASKALPSPEVLRQLLRYDPETGKLFWLNRPVSMFSGERHWKRWNTAFAGKEALNVQSGGYFIGSILNRRFKAHRVAWAIYTGEWPSGEIDHINRCGLDNRAENLRVANRKENMQNTGTYSTNKFGLKGVSVRAKTGSFQATIMVDRKQHYLGSFCTPEAAHEAYVSAAKRLHGKHSSMR